MHVTGGDQLHARMRLTIGASSPALARYWRSMCQMPVLNGGWCRNTAPAARARPKRCLEPRQGRRVEFAMRFAGTLESTAQIEARRFQPLIERADGERIAACGNAARIISRSCDCRECRQRNTMPTLRRSIGTEVMSLPSNSTRPPASGNSSPAMMRSMVVLPQPEGPSSTSVSPGAMSSVAGSSAAGAVGKGLAAALDAQRGAVACGHRFISPAPCRRTSASRPAAE